MKVKKKPHVLFISLAFPPKRDPESVQVAKYFKYLDKSSVAYTVVTSKNPTLYMDEDPSLEHYGDGAEKKLEIKLFEKRLLNSIIHRLFPFLLQFPDPKYSFWLKWRQVSRKLSTKPDLIYSRSYPLSSTFLAYKLAKHFNIPWILHLSDPWAQSSVKSKTPATYFHPLARKFNKKMERKCFQRAKCISFTSQKTIDLYKNAYPEMSDKFVLFPNVYDIQQYKENALSFDDKMRFVYNGGFGEKRDPDLLLKPFADLYKETPDLFKDVELIFTGEATRLNNQKIDAYKYLTFFKNWGMIPYGDLINVQRKANIFLNVDSKISDEAEAVFFPSKLLDYMVAQRKTIAITSKNSTTWDVLEDELGYCVTFEEQTRLKELIRQSIQAYEEKNTLFFTFKQVPVFYASDYQSKRLEQLFSNILGTYSINHEN